MAASTTPTITFTPTAYSLLLLHAARHPANTVTGFLLGSVQGAHATVEKVVTLGHHWTNLAVIEDVALGLLDAHLGSPSTSNSPPLSLLGIYEAPAKTNASAPSLSAIRLANKVAQCAQKQGKGSANVAPLIAGGSLAVVINISQLILIPPVHTLTPFVVSSAPNASSAQPLPTSSISLRDEQTTIAATLQAIREEGLWKDVRDFDDHLEDVGVDWIDNATAVKAIEAGR